VLLVYAVTVGTLGLISFQRASWPARTPRLAIAVYLAGCWSAIAALVLAGAALAVPTTALGGGLSATIGACIIRLRTAYATPGGAVVAGLGLAASGALVVRLLVTAARLVVRTGRQARRQVELALMVGHRQPELGAVVVDDEHPTAFCVGGGRPTVVLTSAALDVLSHDELYAVLAHERAHLAHRHHRLLTVAAVLRGALPVLPLLREAPTELGRLVEMHADDDAAQRHDPSLLASALVLLASATSSAVQQPVLAVAATDVLARMHRLLAPAPPLAMANRRLAVLAAVALALLPLLFAVTPAFVALAQGRVTSR
jgi:beta-lactamase regulating signal transducer with metallopeptidase domain